MALTKVHNRMISQSFVNVRDFGAVGDGITDDGAAIQAAITYARDNSNVVGSGANAGKARNTVYFPPGVYLTKQTLTFYAFINYEGMRATTVDAGADTTDQSDSRGSIIRADVAIYNNDNNTDGVLVYIPTGDITIRGLTFVGTAQINGNSSIGLQWGSSGGVSTTSRPHETDGTGQNCSGVSVEYCSFYTFTKGWECNSMNDAYHYQARFESNTTSVQFGVNTASAYTQSAQFSDSVIFGHSNGIAFSSGPLYAVRFLGGAIDGTANNTSHVVYTSSSGSTKLHLDFSNVHFSHNGSSCYHFNFAGNFDSSNNDIKISNCSFDGDATNRALLRFVRASGTAYCEDVLINNCSFLNTGISFQIARDCTVQGSVIENGYITLNTSPRNNILNNFFSDYGGIGIGVQTADCPNTVIKNNRFQSVTTPISVFDNSTNDTILMQDNIGVTSSPTRGKIIDVVNNIVFANLGTPANGSMIYCPDGTIANPGAGGGTGCFAKRLNGVWAGN